MVVDVPRHIAKQRTPTQKLRTGASSMRCDRSPVGMSDAQALGKKMETWHGGGGEPQLIYVGVVRVQMAVCV